MKKHTMRSVFIVAASLVLTNSALAQKEPPKAKVLGSGASATLSNANAAAIPSTGGPQPTGPAENYGVYKHVDGQGRVTYTNFPVQGGQKIELDPITVLPVIPPSPRPNRPASASVSPPISPPASSPAPAASIAAAPAAQAAPALAPSAVAIVTPIPAPARAAPPAPSATAAALDTPAAPLRPSTVLTLPTAPAPRANPGAAPTPRPVLAATPASAAAVVAAVKPGEDGERRKNLETELAGEEKSRLSVQALLEAERQQGESLKKTLADMAEARISSPDAQRSVERNQQRTRSLQLSLDEHTRNIEALRRELGSKQ